MLKSRDPHLAGGRKKDKEKDHIHIRSYKQNKKEKDNTRGERKEKGKDRKRTMQKQNEMNKEMEARKETGSEKQYTLGAEMSSGKWGVSFICGEHTLKGNTFHTCRRD